MKVKVTAEATRVSDSAEQPLPGERHDRDRHQGLDCDEEEEERNPDEGKSRSAPLLLRLNPADAQLPVQLISQHDHPAECAGYKRKTKTRP